MSTKIALPDSLNFLTQHLHLHHPFLVKLGGFKDGSYVADYFAVRRTTLLLSGGVGSNVRFESDFHDLNPNVTVILVDPTVSVLRMVARGFYHFLLQNQSGFRSLGEVFNYKYTRRHATLIKKFLGPQFLVSEILNSRGFQGMKRTVFVKLDIEGAEYALLEDLLSLKDLFTGLCIEFHGLDQVGNRSKLECFLNELQYHIIHLSINEVCYLQGNFPSVLEVSLMPKGLVGEEMKIPALYPDFLQSSNSLQGDLVCFEN